jgi:hypothetical protein
VIVTGSAVEPEGQLDPLGYRPGGGAVHVVGREEAVEQRQHVALGQLPVDRPPGPAAPLVVGELLLRDLTETRPVRLAPRLIWRRGPFVDDLDEEVLERLVHAAPAIERRQLEHPLGVVAIGQAQDLAEEVAHAALRPGLEPGG